MAPPDVEDTELLTRIGSGDESALETFYYRHQARVYHYARSQLNDPAVAADILNETMLEVWRSATRFAGRSRVSTWMLGIAHHKIIDHLRREGRHVHEELNPAEPDRDTPTITDAIAGAQDAQRLRHCLDSLSAHQREAIHLAFFEQRAYTEIAQITGVPEGTVKTRVYHAKRALKTCLGTGVAPA